MVRALVNSGCYAIRSPIVAGKSGYTTGNICAANDLSALFSLMLKHTSGGVGGIDCIGYTNEGLSGNWQAINLSEDDKTALRPFALSPMVHIKETGQALGRLLFIGGDRVKPTESSNRIATVNLEQANNPNCTKLKKTNK